MKSFSINWKTTAAGVSAVLAAVADIGHQYATDMWDGNRLLTDLSAISAGIGLIFAKDGNAK